MSHSHFTDARAWVFDLDNTLYHPSARLFDLIIEKMNAYMMRSWESISQRRRPFGENTGAPMAPR